MIKYNHEFKVVDGNYIGDPIGKMGFNCSVDAEIDDTLFRYYSVDLSKSSNFRVNIIDNNTTSWIKFENYENIHRFDIIISVAEYSSVGEINFGLPSGSGYIEPQFGRGSITPKLFWPYGYPYERLCEITPNRSALITFRYGNIYYENSVEKGFIGYIPILYNPTGVIPEPEGCTVNIPTEGTLYEDTFLPTFTCSLSSYSLTIFDRRDSIWFTTTNSTIGWNGKLNNTGSDAPDGSYPYVINYQFVGGSSQTISGVILIAGGTFITSYEEYV